MTAANITDERIAELVKELRSMHGYFMTHTAVSGYSDVIEQAVTVLDSHARLLREIAAAPKGQIMFADAGMYEARFEGEEEDYDEGEPVRILRCDDDRGEGGE